jgi:hypothetical protein
MEKGRKKYRKRGHGSCKRGGEKRKPLTVKVPKNL